MKQVSLVALYGQKQIPLEQLIKDCWKRIETSKLRRFFKPYHINQIHGTIIGLEKLISFIDFFNANIWQSSNTKKNMDFDKLSNLLSDFRAITIRVGGFDKSYNKFLSFGKTPSERSFQIQWAAGKFTLIGWPHKNENFTSNKILCEVRNKFHNECNILHKWGNEDNDFFMVIGEIKCPQMLNDSELAELKSEATLLEEDIREFLWENPIDIKITAEELFIAQYQKETLPLDSTNVYCIKSYKLDKDFIENLYT